MTITAIEPRRRQMCALFIDGEYVMNLDAQTLIENRFDVGREIDDDELGEIIEKSNERRAKDKALWLISYRSHSKKELFDKLRRDFDEDSAQKAVDRMQELGLINDGEFAKAYARKLVYGKKMSLRAAELELRRKGIDEITAEQALSELEYDAQTQIIEFISKKYRNIEDEKVRRRAVAALQRKGYGWDDIKQAIESMSGDFD
ncbi:regulatory protein RecX [Ruminococcus sp. JL13D9]|uniref:regulatory protein RecX n=1 Tax=Ruminococcus sp. JL13D9 TaxID=3233381 RepID=UPI00389AE2CE